MIIIDIDKQGQNGTTIFYIADNTTELWMTKYIIGEIFSSGGATLSKNPSDQTVCRLTRRLLEPHTMTVGVQQPEEGEHRKGSEGVQVGVLHKEM